MDNAAFDIDICRQCQHKDCRYCRFNPNGPAISVAQPTVRTRFPDNELPSHDNSCASSMVVQNNPDESPAFKQFVRISPCSGFDVDSGAANIQQAVDAIHKAGFVIVHKSDPTLRVIESLGAKDE